MYLQILPSPDLQSFVKLYRVLKFTFPASVQEIPHKPYPPRPEACLSFYPFDTETVVYPDGKRISNCRSAVYGNHSVVTNRFVGRNFMLLQVVFQPSGFYRLTGISAHELTNCYLDAETVFDKEIRQVNARLSSTVHTPEMIRIVEDYLRLLTRTVQIRAHPLDQTAGLMFQDLDKFSLDWLAKQSFTSTRQFDRIFLERVGISPKYFSRIIRFDRAFRLKNAHTDRDWLRIAIDCGYYDYQHLVKDYKEFTGFTPTSFYLQESQAPERHFGIKET